MSGVDDLIEDRLSDHGLGNSMDQTRLAGPPGSRPSGPLKGPVKTDQTRRLGVKITGRGPRSVMSSTAHRPGGQGEVSDGEVIQDEEARPGPPAQQGLPGSFGVPTGELGEQRPILV